ncbi:VCBS repeat-containing protein [Mariniblastus sp.]|nr:VCBS repeat-containing protein [Mariniblastus sp.]
MLCTQKVFKDMRLSARFFYLGLFLIVLGCGQPESPSEIDNVENNGDLVEESLSEVDKKIESINESEELLQSLAGSMSLIPKWLSDPDLPSPTLFTEAVEYSGIDRFDFRAALAIEDADLGKYCNWPLTAKSKSKMVAAAEIWQPLRAKATLKDCQIGTLSTRFVGDDFETDTKIEGRFLMGNDLVVGVTGYQTFRWSKDDRGEWKISQWNQTKLKLIGSRDVLFEEVTTRLIPDPEALRKVQSSSHVDLILANSQIDSRQFKDTQYKYKHFNDWESAYQYPGVSVVDIDQDGLDDLFVTDRWQSGQLLRNLGDGTFEDVTASAGLDVKKLACCSLFADFDNDGDSDVFVGGTLEPSQYFENDQGKFKLDESLTEEYAFVKFVVSGSVVDINGDGCLDVYLSTYGLGTGDAAQWIGDSVRVKDQVKMRMKVERSHFFLDRAGAPNIVLLNQNGKLTRAEVGDELAQWRNSYQTVWSDFDSDGDQDIYLCNDFSPDRFLRNDTQRGSFKLLFTDVSEELVPGGTMGFGMGASWGDYNNDGLQDLYVSNMYSKAGNRIVEQFDNVDERVKVSARGNFLYQNIGDGKFKQVAGNAMGFQKVAQVGWSFGGQFCDFDNDGNLDLYVPSGFYTPPPEVRKEGDW